MHEILLKKESFNVFMQNKITDSTNVFESILYKIPAVKSQIEKLKKFNIFFTEDVNFLEASFLIFKQKLKEKYGYN